MRTEWMQGYIDALNGTINLQAFEKSKDYEDGYESAFDGELYYRQQAQGESNDF